VKLIQPGRGESRRLVVVYHHDPAADSIQRLVCAAAGDAIVVNETLGAFQNNYSSVRPMAAIVDWAKKASNALHVSQVIVVGFSEGCQAVRAHLLNGDNPDACLAVDGTHSSAPPVEKTQLAPWRKYIDRAKRGERVFIGSHSAIVPPTYPSTRATLERVTGWTLGTVEARKQEGRCVILSSPGTTKEAHWRQARKVLPRMLAEAMSLLDAPAAVPEPPPSRPTAKPVSSLPAAILAAAEKDLTAGHLELVDNHGTWIRMVLARFGIGEGNSFCAAAVSHWINEAAKACGVVSPVKGSAGAKALMAQCQGASAFYAPTRENRGKVAPGHLVFWHRGAAGAWTGHVAVVCSVGIDSFFTIEANSGNVARMAVSMVERKFNDPLLLGFARLE
jgi:hypothetical protein